VGERRGARDAGWGERLARERGWPVREGFADEALRRLVLVRVLLVRVLRWCTGRQVREQE
jgi:hypothetical protein